MTGRQEGESYSQPVLKTQTRPIRARGRKLWPERHSYRAFRAVLSFLGHVMKGNPIEHGLWHWDADRYPPVEHADKAPLKLNGHQPCKVGKDHLGSQEYSGAFYRYLDPAFQAADDQAQHRAPWWQVRSVVECLAHGGLDLVDSSRSMKPRHLNALFALRLGGVRRDVVRERFSCTDGQLNRLEAHILRWYRASPAE